MIFDLDGVLPDSEQLWNRAKEQLTRCSGGRWHKDAPTVMLGMSSPEWAPYVHDELAVPLDPQEINRQVVRRMQELYREQLPLLPGALDVVHALRQRWPLGLASFSNREIIELLLELGGLAGTFAATVSSEEVARGKPAPDMYSRRSREDGRRSCEISRRRGLQQRAASRHRGGHDSDRGAQSALSAHR